MDWSHACWKLDKTCLTKQKSTKRMHAPVWWWHLALSLVIGLHFMREDWADRYANRRVTAKVMLPCRLGLSTVGFHLPVQVNALRNIPKVIELCHQNLIIMFLFFLKASHRFHILAFSPWIMFLFLFFLGEVN